MASRYTKYCPNSDGIYINNIYNILPTTAKVTIKCERCKKEVEQPTSYIIYTFNGKEFCSYTCKQRYIKEHPEEKELTTSEYRVDKYNKSLKRTIEKQIEKYHNKKGKK